jgi:TolB-like protein/Tfp pilus assembly protein PilF/tRNA A-37 threonylcarbamoyl transferase component Bud32
MLGKTISHYKILKKLGGGGMGVVYKAEDTKLKRIVALKFLPPELIRDEEAKQRFIHEARAASALDHPNICTIHEIGGTEDGKMFIAMAYYEGETLKKKIERGALAADEALKLALQIASGLSKAHEKGIIHRDIKPANVMVTSDGVAKIVDFGLAKAAGRTVLTKDNTTVGTVAYMSPEQAQGEAMDHRTDIWSFGVVFYEMITGQLPFRGEHELAIVYSILNEQHEPLARNKSGVSDELQRLVDKALCKNPNKRYQHIDDLILDLQLLKTELETGIKGEYSARRLMSRRRRPSFNMAIVVSLILLIGLVVYLWQGNQMWEKLFKHGYPNRQRIAVLPLINLSGDKEEEYFVDGMTEELIATLSKIGRLRVIARTSVMQYKENIKSIAEIGEELDVSNILEGSVRKDGNKLRITVQLIDVQTQEHRWAEDYDRELKDIFMIQSNVAQRIAEALRMELLPEQRKQIERRSTDDIKAYKLYLRGRDQLRYYNENGIKAALAYFKEAIEIDPGYAEAYAGLGDCYHTISNVYLPPEEAMPKAMAAAKKALEIDNSLAEAHAIVGAVKAFYYWDWVAAEKEFKKALKLNPSSTTVHHTYGYYLLAYGRFEEATFELDQAKRLDPLSLSAEMTAVLPYYYGRRYVQAINKCLKLIETKPDFFAPYGVLGLSHLQMGDISKAVAKLEKATELNKAPSILGYLGYAYALAGRTDEAQKILKDLQGRRANGEYIRPEQIALILIGFGDKDQALSWLEKAYNEKIEQLILLNVDPLYDSIRSDKRFIALLKKMGLKK